MESIRKSLPLFATLLLLAASRARLRRRPPPRLPQMLLGAPASPAG